MKKTSPVMVCRLRAHARTHTRRNIGGVFSDALCLSALWKNPTDVMFSECSMPVYHHRTASSTDLSHNTGSRGLEELGP